MAPSTVHTDDTRDDDLGRVEFVVESRGPGAPVTWLVMRADTTSTGRYARMGLQVTPGARVVVDAQSLRPLGLLDDASPPSRHAGFNPYFDLPAW